MMRKRKTSRSTHAKKTITLTIGAGSSHREATSRFGNSRVPVDAEFAISEHGGLAKCVYLADVADGPDESRCLALTGDERGKRLVRGTRETQVGQRGREGEAMPTGKLVQFG